MTDRSAAPSDPSPALPPTLPVEALDDIPALMPTRLDLGTGEDAPAPTAISWTGWKRILGRIWKALFTDELWTNCGCVGFFGFLSLFPILAVFVLIYGLAFDPSQIDGQIATLRPLMPAEVFDLLADRLRALTANPDSGLTTGLLISTGIALWSGSRGVNALLTLLNMAYHETAARGFLARAGVAVGMTFGGLVGLVVTLFTVAAVPVVLGRLPIGEAAERIALIGRWPILAAFVFAGLLLLYRYGPNRRPAKKRWLMPGAILSTVLWIALSLAFSVYVELTDLYGSTFGTLAVAAVLMLWIYYSALVIGLGAVLNAEIEVQTRLDSTRGPDRPRGERGAVAADRLPRPTG